MDFDKEIDKKLSRSLAMIKWLIDGGTQHGVSLSKFPNITPERIEELYNVDFNKQFNNL